MTSIQWTDETWNPVRGCSLVSPGCTNCYAMRQAHRFSGKGRPYEGLTVLTKGGPVWTGRVRLVPELIEAPRAWTRPRRVFVNSMSDLFHEEVPYDFVDQVFGVMGDCDDFGRGHVFQILTKRPERMLEYMKTRAYRAWNSRRLDAERFPPRNVWLGVSVEDHVRALQRLPVLLKTPAAVRFVSLEPLLGEVDDPPELGAVDWAIIGGESGPGARPTTVGHIRRLVRFLKRHDVPTFVKQLGAKPQNREGELHPLKDSKGGDPAEWPEDLRVREWPR